MHYQSNLRVPETQCEKGQACFLWLLSPLCGSLLATPPIHLSSLDTGNKCDPQIFYKVLMVGKEKSIWSAFFKQVFTLVAHRRVLVIWCLKHQRTK